MFVGSLFDPVYFFVLIQKSNKKNQGCEKIAKNLKCWLKWNWVTAPVHYQTFVRLTG